jgi:hypothetical protein
VGGWVSLGVNRTENRTENRVSTGHSKRIQRASAGGFRMTKNESRLIDSKTYSTAGAS